MILKFKASDDNFIFNIVPKVIKQLVVDKYAKNKKLHLTSSMDNYLKIVEQSSIQEVINNLFDYIHITKLNNIYNIEFKNSLIKLIDFGNSSIRGIHLFDSTLEFLNKNLSTIYKFYNQGGKLNVN